MIQLNPDRLYDRAAEAATLGSMIVDHKVIPAVLELLKGDSFFLEEHQRIFEVIVGLWRQNPDGVVDGLLLRSQLEHANELTDVGGLDYLEQVVQSVPHAHNAVYYAKRVAAKARYRRLVAAAAQIERVVTDGGDVDEQLAEVQRLAMSMDSERTASDIYDVSKCASQVALDTQNASMAIPFGFADLDQLVPGGKPWRIDFGRGPAQHGQDGFRGRRGLEHGEGQEADLVLHFGDECPFVDRAVDCRPCRRESRPCEAGAAR